MTISDIIGAMRSAGCSEPQIDAVVLVLAKLPPATNAERQARYKAKKRAGDNAVTSPVTVKSNAVTSPQGNAVTSETPGIAAGNAVTSPSRARAFSIGEEVDIFKKLDCKQSSKEVAAKPTPRSNLESVLSPEMANAVIDHRRALRKPLTAHAASLLAKAFAEADDPNAAATAMIERAWQGFKVGWLTDPARSGRNR